MPGVGDCELAGAVAGEIPDRAERTSPAFVDGVGLAGVEVESMTSAAREAITKFELAAALDASTTAIANWIPGRRVGCCITPVPSPQTASVSGHPNQGVGPHPHQLDAGEGVG